MQQIIKLNKLELNNGQIEGLPKNPRFIRDEKYNKLKNSIEESPEMLQARELIAYDNNGELVVVCGNMRLRALRELKYKETYVKILPKETSVAYLKKLTIVDNVSFGQHDWDLLGDEWSKEELESWGMEVFFAEDVDYSILDDEDIEENLSEMESNVKKAIQIEFEADHYEEAKELVEYWRSKDAYIGALLIEKLKYEKSLNEK